jgi:large subunit ribosomal protein L23
MDIYQVIKRPVVTERTTLLKEKENKYMFIVDKKANKYQIKDAIEKMFNVDVEKITTLNVKGKLRRLGRYSGYRPSYKKAIVKLAQGQTIKFIEESR